MRRRVLLFEPSPADQTAFRETLATLELDVELIIAGTLTETMAYLSGSDPFEDRRSFPVPNFCFVNVRDVNGVGFSLLRWIRSDVALHAMKVIAVGEMWGRETEQAYDLPFDAVLLKPYGATDVLHAFDVALQGVPLPG